MPGNPLGEIHVVQWNTIQEEAAGIAAFINTRVDAGVVDPGKVLVLPRREFGYLVRDQLNGLNVPAHSFFSEQLLDGAPEKLDESREQQALVLLTLLANPEDRVALRCWCGLVTTPWQTEHGHGFGLHCEASGDSPWQALEKLVNGDLVAAYTGYIVIASKN